MRPCDRFRSTLILMMHFELIAVCFVLFRQRHVFVIVLSAMWLTLTIVTVGNAWSDQLARSGAESRPVKMQTDENKQNDANFLCIFTTFTPSVNKLQVSDGLNVLTSLWQMKIDSTTVICVSSYKVLRARWNAATWKTSLANRICWWRVTVIRLMTRIGKRNWRHQWVDSRDLSASKTIPPSSTWGGVFRRFTVIFVLVRTLSMKSGFEGSRRRPPRLCWRTTTSEMTTFFCLKTEPLNWPIGFNWSL